MKFGKKGAISAVLAAAIALGAAGCGGGITGDVEAPLFDAPDVTVTANGKKTTKISDELFGVFLEDINYASYAMDDNLVSNGSFSYGMATANWTASEGVSALAAYDDPIASTNPSYCKVTAEKGGYLENAGYSVVPPAVTEGGEYEFSVFLRADDYEGDAGVRICKGNETLGETSFSVAKSDSWTKYRATVKTTAAASENVTIRFFFDGAGEFSVDNVALETKDSTVGVKNYIYRALEELSPAFIRFPGGCVIEGKNFESAYDWKNSVGVDGKDEVPELVYEEVSNGERKEVKTRGEWATRKPNVDIWQGSIPYQMDYAIGFYEYFLLCEKLGASAIPIVNCGLSCMIQNDGTGTGKVLPGRYGNGREDYIDDALDLVAFAKGSTTSSDRNEKYWAQVRADMGHPEPFEMHYLGVGNEQFGAAYYEAYEAFLEAFKEAGAKNPLYNEVELIVGNNTHIRNCEGYSGDGDALTAMKAYRAAGKIEKLSEYGLVDHHYYLNFLDFLQHTDFYDYYKRDENDRYGVFVGEYSANSAGTLANGAYGYEQNTLIAALSEAAYMTGLERNGDVVRLAAYAPAFGMQAGGNQWAVDMTYFTNTTLVRSANYYVQQAFMQNAVTETFETEEDEFADEFEETCRIFSSDRARFSYVNKLYKTVGRDERTGDVVVKIVNVDSEPIDLNVKISGIGVKGAADVYRLKGENMAAVNTLASEAVSPERFTMAADKNFGYVVPGYSLTVIRLHVK